MKAPTRNRRPGFSRRAQYGLFISYVVAVTGILVGLGLIVIAHVDPDGFGAVRGAALDVTAPVSSLERGMVRGVGDTTTGIAAYVAAGSRNAAMARELDADRRALVHLRIIALENDRLRKMLKLVDNRPATVAVARIVGSTGVSSRRYATLNAGTSQGVRPGQPVRSAEGLIGHVVYTGAIASRVLLITDNASVVPVRMARGGMPALAAGRGDGSVEIRSVGLVNAPFHAGDVFVTSGTGGIFAPGIPVAKAVSTARDVALARTYAQPDTLDYAMVQKAFVDIPAPAPAADRIP